MFPGHWRPLDWLVPFYRQQLCIHHGHEDPDDHSACGPTIFCCLLAVEKYTQLQPDSQEAQADWELMAAKRLASLLNEQGQVMYFIFCDPIRPEGLWAIGLSGEELLAVLYKQLPLSQLLERSAVTRLA
jgi:hypothetical protein